jgi:hypothetical protein
VKSIIVLLLLACGVAVGQANTTSNVTTTGNCSPVVTGNGNVFHFQYCGTDPDQEKKMVEILKAISESNEKMDAVIDTIKPPNILISKVPTPIPDKPTIATAAPIPPATHPGMSLELYIDRADENAQYGVLCDRSCNPVSICTLQGPNSGILGHLASNPEVAVFFFQRQLPALTACAISVESADDKPIKVIGMMHLSIKDARQVVMNPIQPQHCTVSGGSMMC